MKQRSYIYKFFINYIRFFKSDSAYFVHALLMLTQKPFFPRIVYSIILLFCSLILYICLYNNPYIYFDESNTLNISRQTISDILKILSYEQNFPIYYILIHFSYILFGNTPLSIVIFNFIVWIFSIIIFRKLIKIYVNNESLVSFFTLLYSLTPAAFYYAYTIRMYGLMNLLIIVYLYSYAKYQQSNNIKWVFLASLGSVLLSLVHPSSLVVIPIIFLIGIVTIKKRTHLLITTITAVVSVITILLQIFTKNNILQIYLRDGVEYLKYTNSFFFEFPNLLLFFPSTELGVLFYLVSFYLVFRIFIGRNIFDQKYLPLVVFNLLFFILHLLLTSFTNARHYIFLLTPFLTAFFLGLNLLNSKYKFLFILGSTVFYIWMSLIIINSQLTLNKVVTNFCNQISSLETGLLISDFGHFNTINQCKINDLHHIFISRDGVTDPRVEGETGILIEQAKLGGTLWLSNRKPLPLNYNWDALKAYLEKNNPERVYLVAGLINRNYLYTDELDVFKSYKLEKFITPSIFMFKKIRE